MLFHHSFFVIVQNIILITASLALQARQKGSFGGSEFKK